MLASLCWRDNNVISLFQQTAALMPFVLFAAITIPFPLP